MCLLPVPTKILTYAINKEKGALSRHTLMGAGVGGTHLFLALVIRPLTTHPFRDGAPFLLLIDTSNIRALSTFLPRTTYERFSYPNPFLFAYLWPPGGIKEKSPTARPIPTREDRGDVEGNFAKRNARSVAVKIERRRKINRITRKLTDPHERLGPSRSER